MSQLFIKTVKAKRISPEEQEIIGVSLELISNALQNNSIPNANSIIGTAGILYIYALGSEKQKNEVLEFLTWFKNPESENNFSDDLLNTVRGILGEAKKCSADCECPKCEAEEMKEALNSTFFLLDSET
jgi:hypothetical protein